MIARDKPMERLYFDGTNTMRILHSLPENQHYDIVLYKGDAIDTVQRRNFDAKDIPERLQRLEEQFRFTRAVVTPLSVITQSIQDALVQIQQKQGGTH